MELLVYGMTLGKNRPPSKSKSPSYRFLCIFARVEMLQYHEDWRRKIQKKQNDKNYKPRIILDVTKAKAILDKNHDYKYFADD